MVLFFDFNFNITFSLRIFIPLKKYCNQNEIA